MNKLLSIFFAALMSASMFAALSPAPDDATLNGYKGEGDNLVYAIYVEDSIKCNDIVLVGTYNGWTGSAASCSTFVAVDGFAGWYVCCVADASEDVRAKPAQLDGTGAFNWDYQVKSDAAVVRGTATIEPGYSNECDIKAISTSAPLLIQVKSWKKNPCTIKYRDYTITFISPDCNKEDYITPAISGDFNGWAQQNMNMDTTATIQRQKDGLPGAVFKVTARAAEDTNFKFRSSAEWGAGWSNELKQFVASTGNWVAFNGGASFTFGTDTVLLFDLGNPLQYSWSTCPKVDSYSITLISSPSLGGSIFGSGIYYPHGSVVTIEAYPNNGSYFTHWSDGNTDNPRSFVITQDTTFEAQFAPYNEGSCGDKATWKYANDTLTISGTGALYSYTSTTMPWVLLRDSISAIIIDSGITNIGAYCFYGCSLVKEITFGEQLMSINNYAFAGCSNIRSIICLAPTLVSIHSYTFDGVSNYAKVNVLPTLEEDYQFDENWRRFVIVPLGAMYTITTSASNGIVTGGGTYIKNKKILLTATANKGYHFVQWNDGNTQNPRSVVVTQDTTFEALFAKNIYTITTSANDSSRGSTMGDTIVGYNETISISAIANYGYHFTQWSDENSDNPRFIKVTQSITYTAQFDKNPYIVSTAKDVNTASVTNGGTYSYLDEVELSAIPSLGCQFDHWSDGNTDNPRTLVVTQDTMLIAYSSIIRSGICGDYLTWNYSDGVLAILGTGTMYDYAQGIAPWMAFYKDSVQNVVINNGCTSIGSYAFYGLQNRSYTSLVLPKTVETIGAYAFANCNRLTSISLPASLLEIANYAFSGCVSLDNMSCMASIRPDIYENTFKDVSSLAYLYVPCDNMRSYQLNSYWSRFDIQCSEAEPSTDPVTDVKVEPTENAVTITWPTSADAGSYTIEIKKDGITFCTLTFNADGQLTNIAFAPGRGSSNDIAISETVAGGYKFTITSLTPGTKYNYEVETQDAAGISIASYQGQFTTTGGVATMVTKQFTDSFFKNQQSKFIRNGQLLILRDGKMYNAQGAEVK